jgi:malate synthase
VQVWQWVRYGARLDSGKVVTPELVRAVVDEEMQAARKALGDEK